MLEFRGSKESAEFIKRKLEEECKKGKEWKRRMKRKEEKNKDLKEMSEEKAKDILTLENQSKRNKSVAFSTLR
jgi:hypothetical protein